MRVLYYNWTPFEESKCGGGVSVYLYNLFQYLSSHPTTIQPVFLSSGYYYDNGHKAHIVTRQNIFGFENYSLVNSPIIAPHCCSYSIYRRHLCDTKLISLFRQFLINHGPFDVVHFHSFEGLTSRVLQLKQEFQTTRFIHTLHDYGLICPTVRLWTVDSRNCAFNLDSVHCHSCIRNELSHRYTDYLIIKRMIDGLPHRMTILDRIIRQILIFHNRISFFLNDCFESVRNLNIRMVNTYSDGELCVSQRVKEIASSHGIHSSKCIVSYIGTQAADYSLCRCQTPIDTPVFTILFMGSSAPEKGLSILLNALEQLDPSQYPIVLKVAASIDDLSLLSRLDYLRSRLAGVVHYNGYSHNDFITIMQDVNLGVVPPLWEDNLPQVAIEMVSHGIPVITSTHGGAQELNTHPFFHFLDVEDLKSKIEQIFRHRTLLDDYWSYACSLTTMEEHVRQLIGIYHNG